jgi:hypothetical protein
MSHVKPTNPLFQDLTGVDFKYLHVEEFAGYSAAGKPLWKCKCIRRL